MDSIFIALHATALADGELDEREVLQIIKEIRESRHADALLENTVRSIRGGRA